MSVFSLGTVVSLEASTGLVVFWFFISRLVGRFYKMSGVLPAYVMCGWTSLSTDQAPTAPLDLVLSAFVLKLLWNHPGRSHLSKADSGPVDR